MNISFRLILSIILIGLTQKTMAQTEQKPAPAVLNHIAVYVADLKTASDFYESLFNLPQIPEPFKDGKHTWFSLGQAGHLHIIQGDDSKATFNKNNHLCFSVASIDEFIKKLNAKNIKFEDWPGKPGAVTVRVDGVKQIYFKDLDGHWLEVNDAKE
ncbi:MULTISPECIES: VOC family protein [unclassified Pedobacter]|uniref:VOC family protein n=1 Tax=unclassified Pedobacter TaxID=2628915 RepID=UPI001E641E18|nr:MULTISPECIES: VOC family protein [unclassified Pedobacter]